MELPHVFKRYFRKIGEIRESLFTSRFQLKRTDPIQFDDFLFGKFGEFKVLKSLKFVYNEVNFDGVLIS